MGSYDCQQGAMDDAFTERAYTYNEYDARCSQTNKQTIHPDNVQHIIKANLATVWSTFRTRSLYLLICMQVHVLGNRFKYHCVEHLKCTFVGCLTWARMQSNYTNHNSRTHLRLYDAKRVPSCIALVNSTRNMCVAPHCFTYTT